MSEPTPPRFCKDCRHYLAKVQAKYAQCARSTNPKGFADYLVTGVKSEDMHYYCATERQGLSSTDCGAEARFFEPKPKDPAP